MRLFRKDKKQKLLVNECLILSVIERIKEPMFQHFGITDQDFVLEINTNDYKDVPGMFRYMYDSKIINLNKKKLSKDEQWVINNSEKGRLVKVDHFSYSSWFHENEIEFIQLSDRKVILFLGTIFENSLKFNSMDLFLKWVISVLAQQFSFVNQIKYASLSEIYEISEFHSSNRKKGRHWSQIKAKKDTEKFFKNYKDVVSQVIKEQKSKKESI